MTVSELIEKLKNLPQNLEVYLSPSNSELETHPVVKHWHKFDTVSVIPIADGDVIVLWQFIPG